MQEDRFFHLSRMKNKAWLSRQNVAHLMRTSNLVVFILCQKLRNISLCTINYNSIYTVHSQFLMNTKDDRLIYEVAF